MDFNTILSHFVITGEVQEVKPLGNGLINDTYLVKTASDNDPDYVLQRINNDIFKDVDLLQHNVEVVTKHIRKKLIEKGEKDLDRKVLSFVQTTDGKTYYCDEQGKYWRISVFIKGATSREAVNEESAYYAGLAFGEFENYLVDVPETLGETIPDFHNMEFRMKQLNDAIEANPKQRLAEVQDLVDYIYSKADEMCKAEQLYRKGILPKRVCHCDTKVNNMLFDEEGNILCVIDLDTVMPSYVFSDYGDFLRTGANFVAEDDPDLSKVGFNEPIFQAFTKGYLESAGNFLTDVEIDNLSYAVSLFPFMQCVRFLTDYINGDVYFKTKYENHNLVRALNQRALYDSVLEHKASMDDFINKHRKH
ncbi:phosphotransferase enzyme family protein [Hoylesella nanceiensis]